MDFGYKARELQVKVMSEQIENGYPSLLCGDFNDIGGSSCIRRLHMTDAWWKGGFGFGFTFHGMGLRFRLDHILFQENHLCLKKTFIPHSNTSDHNPLVCDFKFKVSGR